MRLSTFLAFHCYSNSRFARGCKWVVVKKKKKKKKSKSARSDGEKERLWPAPLAWHGSGSHARCHHKTLRLQTVKVTGERTWTTPKCKCPYTDEQFRLTQTKKRECLVLFVFKCLSMAIIFNFIVKRKQTQAEQDMLDFKFRSASTQWYSTPEWDFGRL